MPLWTAVTETAQLCHAFSPFAEISLFSLQAALATKRSHSIFHHPKRFAVSDCYFLCSKTQGHTAKTVTYCFTAWLAYATIARPARISHLASCSRKRKDTTVCKLLPFCTLEVRDFHAGVINSQADILHLIWF